MSSAEQNLQRLLTGTWISQMLYAAAKLGVADHLAGEPMSAEDLAAAVGVQAEPLYRLLRALASEGVFEEDDHHRFSLTPMADLLRSDVATSKQAMAIMLGEEHHAAWGQIIYSLQTGKPAFDHVYGKPVFGYLAEHPEAARNFDAAMTAVHGSETAQMLAAYDFSDCKTLADIGGGNGSLITMVLQRYPKLKGILYDLDHVVARAKPRLEAASVADRCQVIAGSFFESVPSGADTYLMRHIIHDWDEPRCIQILKHCRAALPAGGKVLLIEAVIPPGNKPSFGKLIDINMLVMPGGKERTAAEYKSLYAAAGLKLSRIVPTAGAMSLIEGVAA
ncbi:MAG: methyltransferase [Pirellulales bacterium]|nr:methyltransferase [Pirellulales bacterium]